MKTASMKSVIIFMIVFYSTQSLPLNEKWNSFKKTFNKNYSGTEEEMFRREIFLRNVQQIENHNEKFEKGVVTYKIGINQFSDFTQEELRSFSNGFKMSALEKKSLSVFNPRRKIPLPDKLDWRDTGVVSPVKNQGSCGACWAFSTTGTLEFHYGIYENLTLSFSEQQLVDCVYDSFGCQGGWQDYAFLYIKHNLGINLEKDYPYEAQDGKCRFDRKKIHYNLTDLVHVEVGNEEDLKAAVAEKGPVSVAVNVFGNFYSYESGVYYNEDCDPDILNHAMVVVGYGTENGQDYWLVKNSFSEDWGEKGYIKMARNRGNNCGIADRAMFPLL